MVIVSNLTEPPSEAQLHGLTYATVTEEHRRESRANWTGRDVLNSAIVLGLILIAYLYFTG